MDNLEPEKLELHEGHDEDFDEDDEGAMDESHPMWRSERVTLNSVGIDIGSSTSHLIFSRLTLRRKGEALSIRFEICLSLLTLFPSRRAHSVSTDSV
jgi:ethanolamine utilization protein EutA